MFREQLKSKNTAGNVEFDPKNVHKWLQEWIMVMNGQPLLTAAIIFKFPKEEDGVSPLNHERAVAIWNNSNCALKAKLLESCKNNPHAKGHVLKMDCDGKTAIEILQRLLNDYARVSNAQTQRLHAMLLGPEMDCSKSKTPGQSIISIAVHLQEQIVDAGGECSDEYLKNLILERAKRTKPLTLMMHAYEQSFYVMGRMMSYEDLRNRLMTADDEALSPDDADQKVTELTEVSSTTKEASNAEKKKDKRRCVTCRKFHFGVCRFLKKAPEAHGAGRDVTCDYCDIPGHTEEECFKKKRHEREAKRERDEKDDDGDYRDQRDRDQRDRRDQPLRTPREGGHQRDGGRRVFHERSDYKRRAHAAERETEDDNFDNDYFDHRRGNMFASQAHVLLLKDKNSIVDSGATDIFVKSTTRVDDFQQQRESMSTAKSGSSMDITGRGIVVDTAVTLCDQRLMRNLIGVAPIADRDFTFTFNKRSCTISYDHDRRQSLVLPRQGNLYPCDLADVANFVHRAVSSRRSTHHAAIVEGEEEA